MTAKCDDYIIALEDEVESLKKKIKSIQSTNHTRLTKLANQHHNEEHNLIWKANNHLHDEIALRLATFEQINNLSNKICAHYPDATAAMDISIKQEQE